MKIALNSHGIKIGLMLMIPIISVRCGESSFTGSGKRDQQSASATLGLNSTCDQAIAATDLKVKSPASGVQVVLKGNLCPTSTATVEGLKQVIFIVDVSGSTKTTDPATNGSCGRLVGAQALANALKQQPGSGDRKLAVITFDTTAQLLSQFVPIAESDKVLTSALCRHGSGTNYESAYNLLRQQVIASSTGNLVYLFSDGVPDDKAAGIAAVEQCKKADPAILNYAVFLNKDGNLKSEEARDYLTTLTGAADRVTLVSNAQELASAAVKLLPPAPVGKITATKAEATLSASGLPSTTVALDVDATVTTDGAKSAIGFVSKPFKLLGSPSTPVRQKFHVTMTDASGKTYEQDYFLIYELTK